MRVSDIKIGDWFEYFNGNKGQISSIYDHMVTINGYPSTITKLKPIFLTPEILEKNGWTIINIHSEEYIDDVKYIEYKNPHTYIILRYFIKDKAFLPYSCRYELTDKDIVYVHELQHLLWALGVGDNLKL